MLAIVLFFETLRYACMQSILSNVFWNRCETSFLSKNFFEISAICYNSVNNSPNFQTKAEAMV